MTTEPLLDAYVQRMQNIKPFNIYQISDDGTVAPWWEVTSDIAKDLVIYEQSLGYQVQIISGEINKWHRLAALCNRVWQIEERSYRVWRDKLYLESIDPPDKPDGWKKPTKDTITARYRTHAEYNHYYAKCERAEEAYNSAKGIVEGLRAKRDMLKSYVLKNMDDGAAHLSV